VGNFDLGPDLPLPDASTVRLGGAAPHDDLRKFLAAKVANLRQIIAELDGHAPASV